jgi:lycopene cyclase domain-containing protein
MGSCEIFHEKTGLKEYTILASASIIFVIILDFILGTKLILNKKFWVFWAVMFVLIFIVNGYLTWRPMVIYGESFCLGVRLFTIPVEDFLFGFSLISFNVILWEFYNIKQKRSDTTK